MKRLAAAVAIGTLLSVVLLTTPAQATFSGQNGRIVFAMDRGNGQQIYTIRPNGTDRHRLTHVDGTASSPSWSPDGTKIAFELDRPDDTSGIELMNADGSNLVDITPPKFKHGGIGQPSFTPNGRRIVFAGQACGRCIEAIWSVNLLGGDLRTILAARHLYKKSPRVSPNGKTVVFVVEKHIRNENGLDVNRKSLWTVKMDGTHLTEVVPFSFDVSTVGGDWAPGGKRIVFSNNAGYAGQTVFTEPQNIFTVRPDGTGLKQLTHYRGLPPDLVTAARSYSPDGHWIMFRHFRDGIHTLWKMHPDGSHLTRIVRSKFLFSGYAAWGPRRK